MKIKTTKDKQDKFSPAMSLKAMASHYALGEEGEGEIVNVDAKLENKISRAVEKLHRYFDKNQFGTVIVYKKIEWLLKKMGSLGEIPIDAIIERLIDDYGYTVLEPSSVIWPSNKNNRLIRVSTADKNLHEQMSDDRKRKIRDQIRKIRDRNEDLGERARRMRDEIKQDAEDLKDKREEKKTVSDKIKDNEEAKRELRKSMMEDTMKITKSRLVEIIAEEIREFLKEEDTAYQKFFREKLKKFGVSSPAQLKGDDKKKFYDEIDKEWKGKEELDEKWGKDVDIKQTGEYADKTVAQIKKQMDALKGKKPFNREKFSELQFALRAKQGWKKGKGATKE